MDQDKRDSSKPTVREAREARLAAALRANLRRRKAAASDETGGPPVRGGGEGSDDRRDRD